MPLALKLCYNPALVRKVLPDFHLVPLSFREVV
jgi:hypothetical protein